MENPGYSRTGITQMRLGGISDPRNKALMKMFNLLKIGERAGSGVPSILDVWQQQGWQEPVFTEISNPDRFSVTLSMIQKNVKVADDVTESVTDVTSNVTEKFIKSDEYNISEMDYKVLEQLMLNPSKTTSLYAENLNLEAFFENLLLGKQNDLKNRYLHLDYTYANDSQTAIFNRQTDILNRQNGGLECDLIELALLKIIKDNPKVTQKVLANSVQKSQRAIERVTTKLQQKG